MPSAAQYVRRFSREEIDAITSRGQEAVGSAQSLRNALRQAMSENRQKATLLWLEGCRYELDRRNRRSATFRSWLAAIEGAKASTCPDAAVVFGRPP